VIDRLLLRHAALLLVLPLLATAGGCNIVGAGAVLASKVVPQKVDAQYKGLAGQSVGVMVWCERGIRIDYPTIQLDCATGVQNKLRQAQESKVKELKETNFPVQPASIARYQAQYPQTQSRPITEVAPHLGNKTGLTRLIYVEIEGFSTRPAPGVELFRGSMVGSLKVLEIKDGKARSVYEESDVHASFPRKSPEEGTPNANDAKIYVGTLNEFTTEVVKRFITHEMDEQ
jgi:hypothetical protein